MNVLEGLCHAIEVPVTMQSLQMASDDKWLITEADTNRYAKPFVHLKSNLFVIFTVLFFL